MIKLGVVARHFDNFVAFWYHINMPNLNHGMNTKFENAYGAVISRVCEPIFASSRDIFR